MDLKPGLGELVSDFVTCSLGLADGEISGCILRMV